MPTPIESEDFLSSATAELLNRTLTSDELEDLTEAEATPTTVTFSSQDFDMAGLVRRLQSESMLIPQLGSTDSRLETAGFQRGFVWSRAQMDKFVESLLLGYPVPAIFLVKQSGDNRLLVLDGQQRLTTVRKFVEGQHKDKPFVLTNVADEFKGLTYASLPEDLRIKLDDSYMTATIVAADGTDDVNEAIYQIFERLNSGGTQLTPHEIRVALAAGPLITFLEDLNSASDWRSLYGNRSPRLRDQELVLRILALYMDSSVYSRPLKTFLNKYAARNRQPGEILLAAGEQFLIATESLRRLVGPEGFRRPGIGQVNAAQAESLMVAVMHATNGGQTLSDNLKLHIQSLQKDPDFIYATTRSTADNDSVALRLRLSLEAVKEA